MTIFHENWYTDADAYWSQVEATDNGMLGGLAAAVERPDIQQSRLFLRRLRREKLLTMEQRRACDCGAGIGRVSKHLLLDPKLGWFDSVDMVEFHERFLDTARQDPMLKDKVERFLCTGLELFQPEQERYDLIWVQWVIGHLSDDDLVAFVQRCLHSLPPTGVLCFKENLSRFEEYIVDDQDSSVTRSDALFLRLFERAGARVVAEELQQGFPDELYPVKMYALKRKA